MADRKISDLTALTAPAAGDYLPIVDISEVAAASKNKRITIEELFRGVPLGTAAAPSIAIEGDENTGIYSPGADQLAISTGGTGRLFVDASGNINLGQSSSALQSGGTGLTIYGSANSEIKFLNSTTGATATDGTALVSDAYNFSINNREAGSIIFGTSNTERMRLTSAGLLGLGTSSPIARLHVTGGDSVFGAGNLTRILNASQVIDFTNAAQDTYVAGRLNGLNLKFYTNTGAGIDINSTGRVGIGTSSPTNALLHVSSPISAGAIKSEDTGSTGSFLRILGDAASGNLINWKTGTNLRFATSDDNYGSFTERLRIDSSGRVGIGTTAPSNTLHLSAAANHGITLARTGTNAGGVVLNVTSFGAADFKADNTFNIQSGTTAPIVFNTSGANERARIDSSGRLLVGTSTSRSVGDDAQSPLQVSTTSFGGLSLVNNRADTSAATLSLGKQRSGAVGGSTIVLNNDSLGALIFAGGDGTDLETAAAYIQCFVDGTPGSNDMPGRLVFSTTADGAASPTERMRISSTGQVSINTTADPVTAFFDGTLRVASSTTTTSFRGTGVAGAILQSLWHEATSGDNQFVSFGTETTRLTRGSISYNRAGGLVAYNTTSDYRAKTILGDIDNSGKAIDALKVYRGVMNGATVERPMLVAHEAQEVAPYCVTGEKDAVDDDGNPIYQQMDHQALVPLLIAEIQQLRNRVAALEGE
jgi:hypothetical protein